MAEPTLAQVTAWLAPLDGGRHPYYWDSERAAVCLWRYYCAPERPTLRAIGADYGVTLERIRQNILHARRLLRQPARQRLWRPVLTRDSRLGTVLYSDLANA